MRNRASTNNMNHIESLTPDRMASLFRAAADPTRVRILALLQEAPELCVGDLQERLGAPQPTVSRHLACLLRQGLIARRKDGPFAWYSIRGDGQVKATILALVAQVRGPLARPATPAAEPLRALA